MNLNFLFLHKAALSPNESRTEIKASTLYRQTLRRHPSLSASAVRTRVFHMSRFLFQTLRPQRMRPQNLRWKPKRGPGGTRTRLDGGRLQVLRSSKNPTWRNPSHEAVMQQGDTLPQFPAGEPVSGLVLAVGLRD